MGSVCCEWQKTHPELSCQTGNLLAHITKKAKGICSFRMPFCIQSHLSLGLVLLSSEYSGRSQICTHHRLSYKMGFSSGPHGYFHPVCVCVCVCDSHLSSTFTTKLSEADSTISDSTICPSQNRWEKIISFCFWCEDVLPRIVATILSPWREQADSWGGHESLKDG